MTMDAAAPSDQAAQAGQPAILDRLAALELDRRAALERRKLEQIEQQNPQESLHQFLQDFKLGKEGLEASIAELSAAAAGNDEAAKQHAHQHIEVVAAKILNLERSIADASYFLPSYEQRAAATAVAELKQRVDAARGELIPKKKFSFSRKVNLVKAAAATAASAANGAPSMPAAASAPSTAREGSGSSTAPDEAACCGAGSQRLVASTSTSTPVSYITEYDQQLVRSGRGLQGLRDQVVIKSAADIAGRDFVLLDLRGCIIYLLGAMPALRLHTLHGCTLYTGPITGAVFVNDVQHCKLFMAPYQCRIHHTHHTDFYLRLKSKPIIEHTSSVRFAPYELQQLADEALLQAAEAAGLGQETGTWCQVDDFGWIKASHSPNWCELPVHERQAAQPPASAAQLQQVQQQEQQQQQVQQHDPVNGK